MPVTNLRHRASGRTEHQMVKSEVGTNYFEFRHSLFDIRYSRPVGQNLSQRKKATAMCSGLFEFGSGSTGEMPDLRMSVCVIVYQTGPGIVTLKLGWPE